MNRLSIALLTCSISAASLAAAEPETWPQWRGPNRDGVLNAQPAWPNDFESNSLQKQWRIEDLGPSYSGPIVSADRIFLTETIAKKTEVVSAYDRATGKKLWTADWTGALEVPFFAAKNGSWIRSTPAFDGKRLYVAGIRDVLACLDGETGKVLWKLDFPSEYKSELPAFGTVCSPLVDSEAVYVQAGASFVKVEKLTGKVVWRTVKDDGGMFGSAFSSPILATLAGKEQLVVQTRTKLVGVDKYSGALLWERPIPSFRGMNILTPIAFGDAIFTSTYGGNTQLFNLAAKDEKFAATDAWSFRYEGNMTSPVVVNGHAYVLGKDQTFACFDLKTGKETFRSDKRFGQYWSIVANGDKLLALDQRGILYLVKANPAEFEILAERKVADAEAWAHIAVCGEEIFVRDLNGLTKFRWSAPKK